MLAWFTEVASICGPQIDRVFRLILGITGAGLVSAGASLLWPAWRHRSHRGRRACHLPQDVPSPSPVGRPAHAH